MGWRGHRIMNLGMTLAPARMAPLTQVVARLTQGF